MRSLPATLVLVLLTACGSGDPEAPAPVTGPVVSPPRDFQLRVTGRGLPGRRLPIRLTGDTRGVEVSFLVVKDPLAYHLADERERAGLDHFDMAWFVPAREGRRPALPSLASGEYRIQARRGNLLRTADLLVSDLALVTRCSEEEILVFVADAMKGAPVAHAQVTAGGPLGRVAGVTDSRGIFRTKASPGDRIFAVARLGKRFGTSEVVKRAGGSAGPAVWLAPDRPAYRPGETVHLRGVVRDAAGAVTEGRALLFDAAGDLLAEEELLFPAPGLFSGGLRLPLALKAGPGRLRLLLGKEEREVPLPLLPIESAPLGLFIEAPASVVRGDEVEVRVRVRHDLPTWRPGSRLLYRIFDRHATLLSGERVLGEDEEVILSFPASRPGTFRIEAEIRDPGGNTARATSRLTVHGAELSLTLLTERAFVTRESFTIVTLRPIFHVPDLAKVRGLLRSAGRTREFLLRPEGEPVRFECDLPEPGRHEITAVVKDRRGNEVRAVAEVHRFDGPGLLSGEGSFGLFPERPLFDVGETARVLLTVPPQLTSATLLVTLEGRGLGIHQVLSPGPGARMLSIRIPKGLGTRLALSAVAVREGEIFGAWAPLRVRLPERELEVRLALDPEDPKPEEPFELRIETRDAKGKPVPARLALSLASEELLPWLPDRRASLTDFLLTDRDPLTDGSAPLPGEPGWLASRWVTPPGRDLPLQEEAGWLASRWVTPPGRDLAPEEERLFGEAWTGTTDEEGVTSRPLTLPTRPGRYRLLVEALTADGRVGRTELTFRSPPPEDEPANEEAVPEPPLPGSFEREQHLVRVLNPGRNLIRVTPPPGAVPQELVLILELDPALDPSRVVAQTLKLLTLAPFGPVKESAPALAAEADYLAWLDESDPAPRLEFRGRLRSRVVRLAALEREEGGWGEATAAVVAALLAAQAVGIEVEEDLLLRGGGILAKTPEPAPIRVDLLLAAARPVEPFGLSWGDVASTAAAVRALADSGADGVEEALKGGVRFLVAQRAGLMWEKPGEAAAACRALLAARRRLGPPPKARALVRVRVGRGIAGHARLSIDHDFSVRGRVEVPQAWLPPGVIDLILETEMTVPVLCSVWLRCRGSGAVTDSGIRVERTVRRVSPPGARNTNAIIRPGDLLLVEVTVKPDHHCRGLVLRCPLPEGAEPLPATAFPEVDRSPPPPGLKREHGKDHLRFLLREVGPEGARISFLLRATHQGRFLFHSATAFTPSPESHFGASAERELRVR